MTSGRNGEKIDYNGGRTEGDIVMWVLKRSGPASTEANSCDDLKSKIDTGRLVLVYYGETSSPKYSETFIKVAEGSAVSENFIFFHIDNKECAVALGASDLPALGLFRKFDESPIFYKGSWEAPQVIEWAQALSVPTVIEFSEEFIEPIFGQRKAALMLFRMPNDKDADFAKVFNQAAKELKGEILFVTSGIYDGIQARLAEFIGVDEPKLPVLRLLDPNDNMKKFDFPDLSTISVSGLRDFVARFKAGKLAPFRKSQDIPEHDHNPLKTIVGKNFEDVVLKSNNEVFVKFYAPWCGHCKSMAPTWQDLATELKDVQGLVIADFDATANEAEGVEIQSFPTLKFYQQGQPIDFNGDRTAEGFKSFLKEHSKAYQRYLQGTDL